MHKNKETTWSHKLRLDMWVLNQKKEGGKKKINHQQKKKKEKKKNLILCTCKHHTLPLSQNQKEIIQSFTLVYKEKPGFSLQFPGRYRSRNKSNTIIIVITITIILQSTTNEKNTGNGCYHMLIAALCCTYKKISHSISFFFSFFLPPNLYFSMCVCEHVCVSMCVLHFSLWRVTQLSDLVLKQIWTEIRYYCHFTWNLTKGNRTKPNKSKTEPSGHVFEPPYLTLLFKYSWEVTLIPWPKCVGQRTGNVPSPFSFWMQVSLKQVHLSELRTFRLLWVK